MRRTGLVVVATAVACGARAPAVPAHGETDPSLRAVVERVRPALPGVRVEVVPGIAKRLRVVNRSSDPLEVLDADGVPFLRLGPGGAEANVRAAAWFASGNPDGVARVPATTRGGTAPRWVRIAAAPEWTWFEHRLHPAPGAPGAAAGPSHGTGARDGVLARWTVALRRSGRRAVVEGRLERRRVSGAAIPVLAAGPRLPGGATIAVLPGAVPGLFLASPRSRVTVVGRRGEAFARVGPGGVEVNVRSPTWADQPSGVAGAPRAQPAAPGAAPRWRRLTTTPRFGWLETRALDRREELPAAILASARPTDLRRWAVGLRSRAGDVTVHGVTRWIPARRAGDGLTGGTDPGGDGGDPRAPGAAIALLALLALAGVAASVALRRRAGGRRPPE